MAQQDQTHALRGHEDIDARVELDTTTKHHLQAAIFPGCDQRIAGTPLREQPAVSERTPHTLHGRGDFDPVSEIPELAAHDPLTFAGP